MAAVAGGNATIARAHIQLQPSMQGFFATITQQLTGSSMNSIGNNAGKTFGKGLLGGAGGAIASLTSQVSGAVIDMAKLTTGALLGIGATVAGLSLYGGISRALNIENATSKLRALGNTAEETSSIMNSALLSVQGTAFALDAATGIAANATAAGIQQGEQLTGWLKLIADTATISGASLDDVGRIFNRIQANGRAFTLELNMIADRGIPIFIWLSKQMGISVAEVRKAIAEGKISTEIFAKAIEENIGGAAAESASTTTGAFLNLRTAFSRLGATVTGSSLPNVRLFFLAITDAVDVLNKKYAPALGEWLRKLGDKYIPIIQTMSGKMDEFISKLFKRDETGLSIFDYMYNALTGVRQILGPVLATLQASLPSLMTQVREALGPTVETLFSNPGTNIFTTISQGLAEFVSVFGPVVTGLLTTVLPQLASVILAILPSLGEMLSATGEAVATTLLAILPTAITLFQSSVPLFTDISNIIVDLLPLFTALIQRFVGFAGIIGDNTYLFTGLIIAATTFFTIWKSIGLARTAYAGIQSSMAAVRLFQGELVTGITSIRAWGAAVVTSITGAARTAATAVQTLAARIVTLARTAIISAITAVRTLGASIVLLTTRIWASVTATAASAAAWVRTTAVLIAARVVSLAQAVATGIATAAQWLWNLALTANPIGLVIVGITALVAALAFFFTQTEVGQQAWTNITKFFSESITNIGNWFSELGGHIADVFKGVGNFVTGVVEGIVNSFIGGINFIIGGINSLIDLVNSIQIPIPDWMQEALGLTGTIGVNIPSVSTVGAVSLPRLYTGADVKGSQNGTPVVIGDRNIGESVVNTGLMNANLKAQNVALADANGNGDINYNVVINQQPGEDDDALLDRLEQRVIFRRTR